MSHFEEPVRAMAEKAAGQEHAERMYESRASAESYLMHPESSFRYAALNVLAVHWGPDEGFAAACEDLLAKDRDTNVRGCALQYLCMCYRDTDDTRVGRITAQLVYDNAEPCDLRLAAYRSLFYLRRWHGSTKRPARLPTFRFPEDVDWKFVDSFLYKFGKWRP